MEYVENGDFINEPTLFAVNRSARCDDFKLSISSKGQLFNRSYKIQLIASEKASEVFVDGEKVKFKHNLERKMNLIAVPTKSIRLGTSIKVVFLK